MTNIQTDQLADQLQGSGLVPGDYPLDSNYSFSVPWELSLPAPWNLPSRLFRFPIEVRAAEDGKRRIGLMHPLLKDHPWVGYVEQKLGLSLEPGGAPNEFGYSDAGHALWWHAVDLVSSGHWRDLIETRRFTTDAHIASAVSYGLSYSPHDVDGSTGYLTTKDARQLMTAIGSAEPSGRTGVLLDFAAPQVCRQEKGVERWPINTGRRRASDVEAWGYIFGIEGGWFRHDRAGFLGWTQEGRDRYAVGDKSTYAESGGQGAFAF
jgi:hypothetical protein